jgi:hypothetical protein
MVIGFGAPGDARRGSETNDPYRNTGIEKQYSHSLREKIIKNSKKSKLIAMTANGNRIAGSFFIQDSIRPSDFLRNMETKRVLLVDASINGAEQLAPVLIVIDNCQYITLVDDYESMSG